MRITDIITERSKFHPGIRAHFEQQGYKFLGKGVDQMVFLEPNTGYVLKVFGMQGNTVSPSQKMFLDWAQYCSKNSNNPFLPEYSEIKSFVFEGMHYLMTRSERLFPIPKLTLNHALTGLAVLIQYRPEEADKLTLDTYIDKEFAEKPKVEPRGQGWSPLESPRLDQNIQNSAAQLAMSLTKPEFNLLVETIKDVTALGKKLGYEIDMRSKGNFMLGSDGHIVINDPWHVGESH